MSPRLASGALKAVALTLIALMVGLPTAVATFEHSSRDVVIGAHNATVEPRFDGYATIDFGPVLPRMRVPADQPFNLGVNIDLGDSEVSNLDELVARDAVIASQPDGEIAKVTSTVTGMAGDAALRGIGSGVLAVLIAVLGWRAVGTERRVALRARINSPDRKLVMVSATVGVTVVASVLLIAAPEQPSTDTTEQRWTNLTAVVPNIPTDEVLDKVEISQGAASKGGTALIESAIKTYRTSVDFYGELAAEAATVAVRAPRKGETTALVVTDRHLNIGMDQVARAIADQAKAKTLIDLGDDTSAGGKWEAFSINSLARHFKGFEIVAVAGNHDTGPFTARTMRKAGFTVLDGKPVRVSGIRYLGSRDPRSSGLTAGYSGDESDSIAAIRKQDELLTERACQDGKVDVVLAHSPSSAKKTAASGCAYLVLSGHLHRQVGPDVVRGTNGRNTVTLSTGSTGGAVYAFALGSKLRRPAQVAVVTFRDGRPVGLQSVDFQPGGEVTAQAYVPIVRSEPTAR